MALNHGGEDAPARYGGIRGCGAFEKSLAASWVGACGFYSSLGETRPRKNKTWRYLLSHWWALSSARKAQRLCSGWRRIGYPRRSFIGRNSRLKGSRTRPRISKVRTPSKGSSPGFPRITGECRSTPLRAIRHSDI